jgi:hypothetical protein
MTRSASAAGNDVWIVTEASKPVNVAVVVDVETVPVSATDTAGNAYPIGEIDMRPDEEVLTEFVVVVLRSDCAVYELDEFVSITLLDIDGLSERAAVLTSFRFTEMNDPFDAVALPGVNEIVCDLAFIVIVAEDDENPDEFDVPAYLRSGSSPSCAQKIRSPL